MRSCAKRTWWSTTTRSPPTSSACAANSRRSTLTSTRSKPSTALATGSPSGSSRPRPDHAGGLHPGRRPGPPSGLRLGLRFTLLFALLPLLALPWIGLRFVERMAEMTRDVQAETQQAAARSLAASLHERHELFGL